MTHDRWQHGRLRPQVGLSSHGYTFKCMGGPKPGGVPEQLDKAVSHLGALGWELVAVETNPLTSYWFKRRLLEGE